MFKTHIRSACPREGVWVTKDNMEEVIQYIKETYQPAIEARRLVDVVTGELVSVTVRYRYQNLETGFPSDNEDLIGSVEIKPGVFIYSYVYSSQYTHEGTFSKVLTETGLVGPDRVADSKEWYWQPI